MIDRKLLVMAFAVMAICFSSYAQVEPAVVKEMIDRYEQTGIEIKGHAFDKQMFCEVLAPAYVEQVLLLKGSDSEGVEHLLFKRANGNGSMVDLASVWNHGSGIFSIWPFCCVENSGKRIEETVGQQMIARYQADHGTLAASISKPDLLFLLNNEKVHGIYFAHGITADQVATIVAIGVDKSGMPLWESSVIANSVEVEYPIQTTSRR